METVEAVRNKGVMSGHSEWLSALSMRSECSLQPLRGSLMRRVSCAPDPLHSSPVQGHLDSYSKIIPSPCLGGTVVELHKIV